MSEASEVTEFAGDAYLTAGEHNVLHVQLATTFACPANFYDVTSGSNGYAAVVNYDLCSGLRTRGIFGRGSNSFLHCWYTTMLAESVMDTDKSGQKSSSELLIDIHGPRQRLLGDVHRLRRAT